MVRARSWRAQPAPLAALLLIATACLVSTDAARTLQQAAPASAFRLTLTYDARVPGVPQSPYGDRDKICPAFNGQEVEVGGYPSSPFVYTPFTTRFANPPAAVPVESECRADGHCIVAYNIEVYRKALDLGCPGGQLTQMLTYNGSSPGPTIHETVGHEMIVRMTNNLTDPETLARWPAGELCTNNTRKAAGTSGRPLVVHFHGSATLAPYDGWAEDVFCARESKDYHLPLNRPAIEWYHDHALDLTTENVYAGLAGFTIIHDSKARGGCGEPWGLDSIPESLESLMMFSDKVLDRQCQTYYDHDGPHDQSLYGDLVLVNGRPWPEMNVGPTWRRFRVINAGNSRPLRIALIDAATGSEVSGPNCWIVGADGGFNALAPQRFPGQGMYMGIAERYDVVCDLSGLAEKTLFLWNRRDEDRMKDVPFFCYSHLIAKIVVGPCQNGRASTGRCRQPPGVEFLPAGANVPTPPLGPFKVFTLDDYAVAERRAVNKECDREFKFGRNGGLWAINGETWRSKRVAASDVGQNTFEVWCLSSGGGWFHPVHIHLIDGFVLARNQEVGQVANNERYFPKDVITLDPGAEVALLIRFGPHKGEYMIHCHNTVHEDYEMMRSFVVGPVAGSLTANTTFRPDVLQIGNFLYDTYNNPELPAESATLFPPPISKAYLKRRLDLSLYRIFYPGGNVTEDPRLADRTMNIWRVPQCPAAAGL